MSFPNQKEEDGSTEQQEGKSHAMGCEQEHPKDKRDGKYRGVNRRSPPWTCIYQTAFTNTKGVRKCVYTRKTTCHPIQKTDESVAKETFPSPVKTST